MITLGEYMSEKNKSRKQLITKVVVGSFLSIAVFGFVFADIQNYLPTGKNPTIRTVDGYDISQAELIQERDGLRQQMRMGYQDPLIQQQIIYRALDNLTIRSAILSYAESLGIEASNQDIADILKSIEAFQGIDGQFDKLKFKRLLQNQGISVDTFTDNLSKGIIQEKLTTPITTEFPLTDNITDLINQLAFTEITLDAFSFSFQDLPKKYQETIKPTDEQIKQLYEEKKENLVRPLLKNIDYVIYDAESLKDKITVSDEKIQKYYDENQKTLYYTPKKWKLLQIIFDDEEQANKGYETLMAGSSFKNAAKEMGYELDDIDLGYISPKELTVIDDADVIFSHDIGETTKPIETDFGYAVYFIEGIQPETITPLETVKKEIHDKLWNRELSDYLNNISLRIEDDLAGGAGFSEITEKYGSKIISLTNITPLGTQYGTDDATAAVPDIIPMEYIAEYTVNDEIPIIPLDNDQFALLKITSSEPSRGLTFEEAKQDLVNQDIKAQQNAILTQIAKELKKNDSPDDVIKKYKLDAKEYTIKRNEYIPREIYRDGFEGIIYANKVGQTFKDITDQDALVVKVKAITQPSELPATEAEDFASRLQKNFSRYIQDKALDMLTEKAKIETNDKALAEFMLKEVEG